MLAKSKQAAHIQTHEIKTDLVCFLNPNLNVFNLLVAVYKKILDIVCIVLLRATWLEMSLVVKTCNKKKSLFLELCQHYF